MSTTSVQLDFFVQKTKLSLGFDTEKKVPLQLNVSGLDITQLLALIGTIAIDSDVNETALLLSSGGAQLVVQSNLDRVVNLVYSALHSGVDLTAEVQSTLDTFAAACSDLCLETQCEYTLGMSLQLSSGVTLSPRMADVMIAAASIVHNVELQNQATDVLERLCLTSGNSTEIVGDAAGRIDVLAFASNGVSTVSAVYDLLLRSIALNESITLGASAKLISVLTNIAASSIDIASTADVGTIHRYCADVGFDVEINASMWASLYIYGQRASPEMDIGSSISEMLIVLRPLSDIAEVTLGEYTAMTMNDWFYKYVE